MLNVVQLTARCFRGLNIAKVTSTNSYIQVQKYSRYTSRKPAAIVNEDELFDVEEAAYPVEKQTHSKRRNKKFYRNEEASSSDSDDGEQTVPKAFTKRPRKKPEPQVDSSKKNIFTKLYENEKLLSTLMTEIKSRRKRRKTDRILLEGNRLITDAIQAGEIPEMIIFSNADDLKKLPLPEKDLKIYKVPYRTIQLWSSLTTPSGIMGIFKTPNVENFQSPNSLPITIICDNVRDPGNMGSILRAAAGVGCEKVILSKGCVDLWESKVLRSAAGAHFRLPIFSSKEWYEIRQMLSPESQVVVADNKVEAEDSFNNENEPGEIEEVANIEEENVKKENINEENFGKENDSKTKYKKYERVDLSREIPVIPYFSRDYTQGETVIIIGGETEGLSEESFKLVSDTQGVRVNVPLNNGVESLNSGMALGIIAFEVKRQFLIAAESQIKV